MVKDKDNNNINNSSKSLVFARWPQTKRGILLAQQHLDQRHQHLKIPLYAKTVRTETAQNGNDDEVINLITF